MSEYNIQMNKYNALNVEYDQLYPATKIENVDGLNTALQNKAPAGYGWGESKALTAPYNDPDYIAKTCIFTAADGNVPADGIWLGFACFSTDGANGNMFMRALTGQVGAMATRYKIDGTWTDWDWINPPMAVGKEYRTTERYMGKPVYVKLVDFGALPNSTIKMVSTRLNPDSNSVISIQGEMYNSTEVEPFPVFFSPGELKAYHYGIVSGSWHIGVRTTADLTGYNARFLVKYTKTTD